MLQKEILNEKFRPLWTEIGFFFLPRFQSTKQAPEAFFLTYRLIKSGREFFIQSYNSYSFLQSNQTIQAFLRIMNSASYSSFWFQIFPVSLDYSANRVVMQIGELKIRGYFRPCSHVTETQGFVQQKKLKGKRKRPKKWNYTLINLCHPVKCIHCLCCLHFEESCSLLIAERRFW